jgi:hypothetical protein
MKCDHYDPTPIDHRTINSKTYTRFCCSLPDCDGDWWENEDEEECDPEEDADAEPETEDEEEDQ